MDYRNEDYGYVHQQVIDNLRPEYETWIERLKQNTDSHKKDIIRAILAKLEKKVKYL